MHVRVCVKEGTQMINVRKMWCERMKSQPGIREKGDNRCRLSVASSNQISCFHDSHRWRLRPDPFFFFFSSFVWGQICIPTCDLASFYCRPEGGSKKDGMLIHSLYFLYSSTFRFLLWNRHFLAHSDIHFFWQLWEVGGRVQTLRLLCSYVEPISLWCILFLMQQQPDIPVETIFTSV